MRTLQVAAGLAIATLMAGCSPESTPEKPKSQPKALPRAEAQAAPSQQPAKTLTVDLGDTVKMELVLIPAGGFTMGSPESEKYRGNDEKQHDVTISKPFYMGVTHVTVDQFAAFAKDTGYKSDAEKQGSGSSIKFVDGRWDFKMNVPGVSWRNPSYEQRGDHPVVWVSWNDARAFCEWLSKKSGLSVRLPTEAEWEYACRAGTKTAYPWGQNPDDGKGWVNGADDTFRKQLFNTPSNETVFSFEDGFVFTSPVGEFKANAFGLRGMVGNAFQWCSDSYDDYSQGPASDPVGTGDGSFRVLRGGSWDCGRNACRCAFRLKKEPGPPKDVSHGFRVAAEASGRR